MAYFVKEKQGFFLNKNQAGTDKNGLQIAERAIAYIHNVIKTASCAQ